MRAIAASAARVRDVRAWVCVTRVSKFARDFSAVFWCALVTPIFWAVFAPVFGWVFSACFLGVGGCACGLFGLWVLGCVWVGIVGERERQRQPRKGERAQGRTATANGASVNGRTACPFSSVRQILSF